MKAFIFEIDQGLTSDWHSGGSALVVAEDEAEARVALAGAARLKDGSCNPAEVTLTDTLAVAKREKPRVLIFPDAGCC